MTDQCKNCTVKGNLIECKKTPCGHHENWYAKKQQKRIDELEDAIHQHRDTFPDEMLIGEETLWNVIST